jgi:DNA polymerase-1
MLAIDIETYDPNLHDLGDGAIRGDGHVICVGCYKPGFSRMYDEITPELIAMLASDETKVFHNGLYDLSWLVLGCGLKVNGRIEDTMTRMVLLDEHMPNIDLDSCCERFGVLGKNKADTIEQWGIDHGIKNIIKHLDEAYSTPSGKEAVQKYCLQDCKATYDLWYAQESYIEQYELQEPNDIECRLYPILLDMKKNGVRIDKPYLEKFGARVRETYDKQLKTLGYEYGIDDALMRSPKKMTTKMHELGIVSPRKTPTGAESWDALSLSMIDHPVCELITASKMNMALLSKYIDGTFKNYTVGEHIHPTLMPARRLDGGTTTSRFSCRAPNLQNISAREEKMGQEMRRIIIPEDGCMIGAFDYSQQEYLFLAHYAVGPRSDWLRQQANQGKDFHNLAQEITGIKNRSIVKTFNYATMYGAGLNKIREGTARKTFMREAEEAGVDFMTYTHQIYNQYFFNMSFLKPTMASIENEVRTTGYTRSIGGHIHHVKSLDKIYTATNYKIQGSAAEMLKKAMVDCWDAGVFEVLKFHLTVHDEKLVSIPYNKQGTEAAQEMKSIMETTYQERLSIPMKVGAEVGASWGYWASDIWQDMIVGKFDRTLGEDKFESTYTGERI